MSVTGQRTTKYGAKTCKQCGSTFLKQAKLSRAQWDKKEFCSNRCRGISRRREIHVFDGRAYIWDGDRRRLRSHVVMEDKLGRPLQRGEVVDHINGDYADDRPENLRLFATQRDHMLAHWDEGTITATPGMGGSQRHRDQWPEARRVA